MQISYANDVCPPTRLVDWSTQRAIRRATSGNVDNFYALVFIIICNEMQASMK